MNPIYLSLARGLHILAAVYNLIYVYTPLHQWPQGFSIVQYVSLPLLLVSGGMMIHLKKKAAQLS